MTIFLFAKQFVDMLYQYQILDYIMVVLVFLMLIYQVALVRPDIRSHFMLTDGIILLLGGFLTITWIRSGSGYQAYFKVLSAFLIYFVGRIYYDRIKECYGTLVFSSYVIIYLNFIKRIATFGMDLLKVKDAGGDFYYNDTDMAFAMILAMVFIAMFGRNSVRKLITIFLVCPYMVFWSDAGIQMALIWAVYAVMAIYVSELVLRKKKLSGALLSIIIAGLLLIVFILYVPVLGLGNQQTVVELFSHRLFDNDNMYGRYFEWSNVLEISSKQGMFSKLFGTGMGADLKIQSLYIKIYYSLGYVGLALTLLTIISIMYYVVKIKDRKTFYLAVIMAVLLLGSGVAINSMESTQMSWFPMLFSGMVISSVQAEGVKETENGHDSNSYGNH